MGFVVFAPLSFFEGTACGWFAWKRNRTLVLTLNEEGVRAGGSH